MPTLHCLVRLNKCVYRFYIGFHWEGEATRLILTSTEKV